MDSLQKQYKDVMDRWRKGQREGVWEQVRKGRMAEGQRDRQINR